MLGVPPERRSAIAEEWLILTLQTYPSQSMQFLLREQDSFRNPVGRTLKEGIPRLVDELLGDMDSERIRQTLEEIVRIRAVQNFSARQAVGFVFLLKRILRGEFPPDSVLSQELEGRLDELILVAFDLYMRCREQISEIQVGEAKRRVAQLERIYTEVERR